MTANPYREVTTRMCSRRNLSKTRRLHFERGLLNYHALKQDDAFAYHVQSVVPEAWDTLERDVDVDEPKAKMTLYLDRSVAKFFRAMGKGYQARINRILATFAQMRIADIKRLDDMMEEEQKQVEKLREEK